MPPNIQEEKTSLQGGEESSLPYTTSASSYPSTNLSQEGLYDAMAHAYPSLPSSLGLFILMFHTHMGIIYSKGPILYHTNTQSIPVKWGSTIPWPIPCLTSHRHPDPHIYGKFQSSLHIFLFFLQKTSNKKVLLSGTSGCHTSSPDFYPSPSVYGQAAYAAYPGYSYPANSNSIASK